MRFFSFLRRSALAVPAVCTAILLTACGGDGDVKPLELTSEGLRERVRALSAPAVAAAENPDLPGYLSPQVLGVTKVAERRVSRTVYDYDFVVQLKNGSRALSNLQAVLTGAGAGSTILAATANVGEVPADATVTSSGKVTLRHDRAQPFSTAALTWAFKGVVTASRDPIVVRRADPAMIRTLSDGQRVVMSELIAVTDGVQGLDRDLAMFARLGADVVGRVPEANLYQLVLRDVLDEAGLLAAQERLAHEIHIVAVSFNGVADTAEGSGRFRTNDAFFDDQAKPLDAARVTVAWQTIQDNFTYIGNPGKNRSFSAVRVGVIDGGFVETVRDLQFEKLWGPEGGDDWQPDIEGGQPNTHGMHVAGIIAATGNNGTDADNTTSQIAGVAWQARPRISAAKTDLSWVVNFGHMARLARHGVRVINFSMGYKNRADRENQARLTAHSLRGLLRYYDFLLVMSAGNDFDDATRHQPLAHIFRVEPDWNPFDDIRGNVLIVANADTTAGPAVLSDYQWKKFVVDGDDGTELVRDLWCENCGPSNYGVGVQIAAPGHLLVSLSDDNAPTTPRINKEIQSGTSMAAPVVSGAAATVFAIDGTLKAWRVKELITTSAGAPIGFRCAGDDRLVRICGRKELGNIKHPLLDMDKAVLAAMGSAGGDYKPPVHTKTALFITLQCRSPKEAPPGSPLTYDTWNKSLVTQLKRLTDAGAEIEELTVARRGPTLFEELSPGRYVLLLQDVEGNGASWSTDRPIYKVDIVLPPTVLIEAQEVQIRFTAADKSGCDSLLTRQPPPAVTHSADIQASARVQALTFVERFDSGSGWNLRLNVTSMDANGNHGSFDFGNGQCTGTLTYEGKDGGGNYMFQENHQAGNCWRTCKIAMAPDASFYNERCTGGPYNGGDIAPANRRWLLPSPSSAQLDQLLTVAAPLAGLAGHWTFDDCALGTGKAADSSAMRREAQYAASCALGKRGSALEFMNPGFNTYGGTHSVHLPVHTSAAITFSAWVKWLGTVQSSDTHGFAGALWSLETHGYEPFIGIWINEGGAAGDGGKIWTDRFANSTYQLKRDEWTMVSISSDGTRETLYLNGEPINTSVYSKAVSYLGFESYVAKHYWGSPATGRSGWAARFRGVVDDVRIYGRSLSDAEIRALYEATR